MKRDLTYEIEHHDIFRMFKPPSNLLTPRFQLQITNRERDNLGRTRRTTVVDYQTIEIRNDHLFVAIFGFN